jgi:hypothetical protein
MKSAGQSTPHEWKTRYIYLGVVRVIQYTSSPAHKHASSPAHNTQAQRYTSTQHTSTVHQHTVHKHTVHQHIVHKHTVHQHTAHQFTSTQYTSTTVHQHTVHSSPAHSTQHTNTQFTSTQYTSTPVHQHTTHKHTSSPAYSIQAHQYTHGTWLSHMVLWTQIRPTRIQQPLVECALQKGLYTILHLQVSSLTAVCPFIFMLSAVYNWSKHRKIQRCSNRVNMTVVTNITAVITITQLTNNNLTSYR